MSCLVRGVYLCLKLQNDKKIQGQYAGFYATLVYVEILPVIPAGNVQLYVFWW